jgi:hypothetical protein
MKTIGFNRMRYLSFRSQSDLALAWARDIDAGEAAKRPLLERLFIVIQYFQRKEAA